MSATLSDERTWIVPSEWEKANERKLVYCTVALLFVGVLWRLVRYLLCFPIWGDEAFLVLNLLDNDYIGLTQRLENCQVAPILFLWSELTIIKVLGTSEWALRLLPLLAGLGSLYLIARLAWLTLAPFARMLAVGFLSVAIWPVSMSTNIKPYAFDLFMSLALLLPAVHWLLRPERLRWLVVLCAVVPIALLFSYPVAFVAGGVSLALLPAVWRSRDWRVYSLFVLFNVLMLATFLGHYLLVSVNHLDTVTHGTSTREGMHRYWQKAFPPFEALGLAKWFVLIHTGQLMSFPMGDSNGGSTVTFLLFCVGIFSLWKLRRRSFLALCLAPFLLAMVASFLRKYPYGASCRLSQFLAPAIVILAGSGASYLLHRWLQRPEFRLRGAYSWTFFLCLVGVGTTLFHVIKPYREPQDLWYRQMTNVLFRDKPKDVPIIVLHERGSLDVVLRYYLQRQSSDVRWLENGKPPLSPSDSTAWFVRFEVGSPHEMKAVQYPAPLRVSWSMREKMRFEHPRYRKPREVLRVDVSSWLRDRNRAANEPSTSFANQPISAEK